MDFPFSRTLGAGTHNLGNTDLNVLVDTSVGEVNLILPNISSLMEFLSTQGYSVGAVGIFPMNIVDVSGNAKINNINIFPNGSDGISGGVSSIVLNVNYGNVLFKPVSNTLWGAIGRTFSPISKGIFNNTGSPYSNVDFTNENFYDYSEVIIGGVSSILEQNFIINKSPFLHYFSANNVGVTEKVTFSNNSLIQGIHFTDCPLINELNLINNPLLYIVDVRPVGLGTLLLSSVVLTGCPLLSDVTLINQSLPTSVVDYILATLDANGLSGGTVSLSGGTNGVPTGGGANPNVLSLLSKGWSVSTN